MGARIIAYGFIGAFAIASLVLLAIAVGSTVQRATLVLFGTGAEATVVAKKQVGHLQGGAVAYAPILEFTARDGRTYQVTSDFSGPESAYQFGQHLRLLYRPDHPDGARIDAFVPMWILPFVTGIVGAAFSIVPAMVISTWVRRRRAAAGHALPEEPDGTTGRGLRRVIGVVLIVAGVLLAGASLKSPNPAASNAVEIRVVGTSIGVLLAASGVLLAQWVAEGSRTYHALGGLVMTSMAVMFGWIAFFGQASGFSVSAGIGGATVSSGGGVMAARIAFGIGSVLIGIASLWAWRQVVRRRGVP